MSLIRIRRFLRRRDGATAVEYAVMLAMIISAIIAAIGAVGAQTGGLWTGVQGGLNAAGFGS